MPFIYILQKLYSTIISWFEIGIFILTLFIHTHHNMNVETDAPPVHIHTYFGDKNDLLQSDFTETETDWHRFTSSDLPISPFVSR